jgi:hypothetical protein
MKRTLILLAVLSLALVVRGLAQDDKVRVFVTDDPSFESNTIVRNNAAVSHTQAGADPRTTEMQAEVFKACPAVIVTSDPHELRSLS